MSAHITPTTATIAVCHCTCGTGDYCECDPFNCGCHASNYGPDFDRYRKALDDFDRAVTQNQQERERRAFYAEPWAPLLDARPWRPRLRPRPTPPTVAGSPLRVTRQRSRRAIRLPRAPPTVLLSATTWTSLEGENDEPPHRPTRAPIPPTVGASPKPGPDSASSAQRVARGVGTAVASASARGKSTARTASSTVLPHPDRAATIAARLHPRPQGRVAD